MEISPAYKRVAVFGGAGFIGSHLVKFLSQQGIQENIILDIQIPNWPLPQGVRFQHCDVRKPISPTLFPEVDLVINLAAIAREPGYPDQDYYDTNVGGAENITRYCELAGVKNLWFTSSMSIYGPSETPCLEDTVPNPQTPYGKSKRIAEEIHCRWLSSNPDRRLLIVRPAVIFGARERGNFSRLARSLERGFFVYPGRSDTIKACGYVTELIESMVFMDCRNNRYLLYNFCYPKEYTIKEICRTFSKIANYRRPLGTIPLPLMLFVAKIFQTLNQLGLKNNIHPMRIYKLVRSTNIFPGELIKQGYPFKTDLNKGLELWLSDEPQGDFI